MSSATGIELRRVTIVAPNRRIDVSLPANVPLAHMMPTLLNAAGQHLADTGLAHSGWVLQRLDEAPLNPAQTLSASQVRDGDVFYFRPQMAQLPEMSFDDVADVIATGIMERSDRWRPHTTRGFALCGGAAMVMLGAVAVVLSGPPWPAAAGAAGLVALLLLVAGTVLSRALGDAGAGAVLGYCALPYGFLAGLLAPARKVDVLALGAPHLLAGFGATALVAVVAGFAIVQGLPDFFGIALASLVATACAGVSMGFPDVRAAGVAAVAASLFVLPLTGLVPQASFRLARLPLPAVPASAEELRSDTQTVNGRVVLDRTAVADRFATGLVGGASLVVAGTQLMLVTTPGWVARVLSIALSLALILRARVFRGRTQRGWMLIAGLGGLGVMSVGVAVTQSQTVTLATILVPLLVAAGIVVALGLWLPRHRPTPFWGRAGDIVDILIVISLIPLALGVLNTYQWIRGLAG
jgi:type VII secretion integral membrane protein EccD